MGCGSSRITSVERQGQKHQLHRDVVCSALLVIGRLIFMFRLNKQLAMLSIVSCFALKTQLANTVNEQVESWGSDGLLEAKPLCLNSFPLTFQHRWSPVKHVTKLHVQSQRGNKSWFIQIACVTAQTNQMAPERSLVIKNELLAQKCKDLGQVGSEL